MAMPLTIVKAERKESTAILQYHRGLRSDIVSLGSLGSGLEPKLTLLCSHFFFLFVFN